MTIFSRALAAAAIAAAGAVSATAQDADASGITDMRLGNADAPVTVIEYASFTCPHCKNFHADGFKRLTADFIDTDQINFIYRERSEEHTSELQSRI